jgi:DNA-directed RNA polymerase specialized sigma subunit
MCTNAVMVDFARWKEQAHLWDRANRSDNGDEETDPFATIIDADMRPEREVARREMQEILWQKLESLCNSEKELLVVHGYFVLDLKPREIYDLYSEDFDDVRDVSRTKDNFLARIRLNNEFAEFLDDA